MTIATDASDRPRLGRILAWFALPLFFVVGFPLAYVSALHDPTPHNLALTVVGPDAVVTPIVDGLDTGDEFRVTQSSSTPDAERSVKNRDAAGGILVTVDMQAPSRGESVPSVTAYVASAEGRATVSVVQTVADNLARQLGTTARTVDVAPLADEDPLGTNLFYFLIFCSIGGYLVIITLSEVWGPSLRARLVGGVVAAIVTPPVVFWLSAIVVGDYGADAGTIARLLAAASVYVFVCALAAILAEQIIGPAITIGVIALVVFMNFPSSGGATPASLLPAFWQSVHGVWFGAGAMESFRSIIYFDGAHSYRWLLQLTAWVFALFVIVSLVHLARTTGHLRRAIDALREGKPVDDETKDTPRPLPVGIRIVGAVALPLFFIICFVFSYLTAFHAPTPNHMPITIAGPEQVTSPIVAGVDSRSPGSFDFTTTRDPTAARQAVEDRSSSGALVVSGNEVITYVASGGGRIAVPAVESLGSQVAESIGGTAEVVDVAPLAPKDATGTGLFYLLIVCSVGGYLTINALWQTFPLARLRVQLALSVGVALIAPTMAIPVESLFVGFYDASVGQMLGVWGVAFLYTYIAAMLATLLTRLFKTASTFGVTVFLLALNFPSAGGAIPASMLPGFWQGVHSVWFGAAALEAMRSIVYFDGAALGGWLVRLAIWAVVVTVVVLGVRLVQERKHFPAEPTGHERELTVPGVEAAAGSL
ncbi:ABC transporter permease [Gordonia rhizosphera]|uniref:DUF3533 domain-containing protein n=1 Tax=Gordonia rhizosphera NBRC 16068 TaxID=1108045 RepID=K6V8W7_9ACTN|nr:ABC transporter permease [Gordonia rhizosphera]GAB92668.1 hypothetical protein GORHZ_186_00380 [Gordonia rhizosphera NBRC 16068]